jgi:hypothetical protein
LKQITSQDSSTNANHRPESWSRRTYSRRQQLTELRSQGDTALAPMTCGFATEERHSNAEISIEVVSQRSELAAQISEQAK